MMTVLLDSVLDDADWPKQSWDLPPYKSAEFMVLFPDLDKFRALPVYAAAEQSGLILDDEWMGAPIGGGGARLKTAAPQPEDGGK